MTSFFVISSIFIVCYATMFSILNFGFLLNKKNLKPTFELVPITVIIPLRNEESNIANLIHSLLKLNYNLNIVEFIFIDDHSTDRSYAVLATELKHSALIYKLIKQTEQKAGKKQAIETAVKNAKNERQSNIP